MWTWEISTTSGVAERVEVDAVVAAQVGEPRRSAPGR